MKSKPMTLSALFEHEAAWPKHTGAKERATRNRFGVGPARYYQALDNVIDEQRAEALALDAPLVHRLLRLRKERTARRMRTVLGPKAAAAHAHRRDDGTLTDRSTS